MSFEKSDKFNNNEKPTESNESLDDKESALTNEIVEELNEYDQNLEEVEALVEDESMSESMKERVLSSIDRISDELQSKFLLRFGGSAVMGGVLALQEYLIHTQQTPIQEGSLLAQGNKVAIAGVALYATIKSIQFVAEKFKAHGVKRGVEKGTVEGAANAASYISSEGEKVDLNTSEGALDISHNEHMSLYDEAAGIHAEEVKEPYYTKENHEEWKTVMRRWRNEVSEILWSLNL